MLGEGGTARLGLLGSGGGRGWLSHQPQRLSRLLPAGGLPGVLGWEPGWPQLSLGPDKPEKKKADCEGKEAPADKGGKGTPIPSAPSPQPPWRAGSGRAGRADGWPGELAAGCWEPAALRSLCLPVPVPRLPGVGTGTGPVETGFSTLV